MGEECQSQKWLVYGLGPDEYSRIQSCTTTKEIWDTLQVAHEGTPQVKRSRGALLYSQYENFTMKEGETIQEIYTWFTTLTNKLKCIRRIISEEDRVEKILTRKANHEDRCIQDGKEPGTQNHSDLEDDEMAMITKDFKKYLMRGKVSSRSGGYNKPRVPEKQTNEGCYKSSDALSWLQEHYNSNRREIGFENLPPKWDPKSKYLTLPENKICTHCGKTGHYKSECIAKEKTSQKNKKFVQGKNRLPGWAKKNLIHPFAYRKGPKLVWVPKTNPRFPFAGPSKGEQPNMVHG
ncbi:uncharacterized protein [Nicotiana tomentosiformis]|uniref:uncharacterized protein n=1 Tax=Nicotiana tomentosiformis TaxID=4098 RepID=UPI00388C5A6D